MYDRSAWFPRVYHVNLARLVLFAVSVRVSEEAETRLPSFCVQCIIKQLLDSVFVISRIINVSVRVISLSLRLRLITLTSTLIILDITKTSSDNCLLSCRFGRTAKFWLPLVLRAQLPYARLPFYIPFWQKRYPIYIPFIEKRCPSHLPTLGILVLIFT